MLCGFNRTFLVLKYHARLALARAFLGFNRTFLVLKCLRRRSYSAGKATVLIAPFWY